MTEAVSGRPAVSSMQRDQLGTISDIGETIGSSPRSLTSLMGSHRSNNDGATTKRMRGKGRSELRSAKRKKQRALEEKVG